MRVEAAAAGADGAESGVAAVCGVTQPLAHDGGIRRGPEDGQVAATIQGDIAMMAISIL